MSCIINASTSTGLVETADLSGSLQFQTNSGTTAMTIDTSQNVGIGTSSPSAKIEVLNNSAGSIATQLFVRNGSAVDGSGARIDFAALDSAVATGSVSNVRDSAGSYSVRFSTYGGGSNTERMRIDSSGNLLVGTTTAGFTNSNSMYFFPSLGASVNQHASGTGSGTNYQYFIYNANIIGYISQNGTTGVTYATSSDYRLKENIAPMTGALDKVSQLKPVTYTWKADGSDGQGFIAHELQAVVPDAVTGQKDAVDAEGNPVYQGIDTSFLVATLTAAIQEQQAIITDLKARIETLESK